jgi:hypothetical protein
MRTLDARSDTSTYAARARASPRFDGRRGGLRAIQRDIGNANGRAGFCQS